MFTLNEDQQSDRLTVRQSALHAFASHSEPHAGRCQVEQQLEKASVEKAWECMGYIKHVHETMFLFQKHGLLSLPAPPPLPCDRDCRDQALETIYVCAGIHRFQQVMCVCVLIVNL